MRIPTLPRMRIAVLQHDDEAPLNSLETAFVARGAELVVFRRHDLPASIDGFDALVVLGAVESVLDQDGDGWYAAEQRLLRAADARNVPILGVCFGAQALADTFGGAVTVLATPEVGWTTARTARPDVVPPGPWLNFHCDAVVPPPGAEVIAASDRCVQAFRYGPHLAVQFHPEVTADQVTYWCDWLRSSLDAAGRDRDEIVAESHAHEAANIARCAALVDAFLDGKHTA